MSVPIFFYIPNYKNIPQELLLNNENFVNLKPYGVSDGENAWLIITCQKLIEQGINCQITDVFSDSGIIFGTYESLKYYQKPSQNSLLVYVKGDKPIHPYANLTIVQNSYEISNLQHSHFIPLWSQPGLKPRNSSRVNIFQNVAYFGEYGNLAPEMKEKSWGKTINSMGLQWMIKEHQDWSNYTDVDVVIAVRDFSKKVSGKYTKEQGAWKPATKLYNAWIAGVPAILGKEPAFAELRKSPLDYIEVESPEEILLALKELQNNPKLRSQMIENGLRRGEEFKDRVITSKWIDFINKIAIPELVKWQRKSSLSKKIFYLNRFTAMKLAHYKKKIIGRSSHI